VQKREIYPNAPVVLVAFEVRHPDAGSLTKVQQRLIKQKLSKDLPIQRTGQLTRIEGVLGETSTPTLKVENFPKYFSRDSTTSASFRDTAVVIETTRYGSWDDLHSLTIEALRARAAAGDLDGIERVGLRYVNEIRVPADENFDWEPWVDLSLLGPRDIAEKIRLPIDRLQGVTVFSPGAQRSVVLRYGSAEGYAVDPGGDLKRPVAHTPGPFFLIDIDSFWTPDEGVPEFDVERLATMADQLHDPVNDLFEALITDRLREEVLRDEHA
jgi:uncharacterized protein (TIGR04255 family)